MDPFHRKALPHDSRTGRDCQFCLQMDPNFGSRAPLDRLVGSHTGDTASAHLTEDGHVRHRIAELTKRRFTVSGLLDFAKTA